MHLKKTALPEKFVHLNPDVGDFQNLTAFFLSKDISLVQFS